MGQGDAANLRFWAWVRTADKTSPDYLEDAVAVHLPVKPFAAPEAVATSGEVSGPRADESVFMPYSVNPLLGEMVVQVSPSLAAATTDSLKYVKEYAYESTDQTVSRFLPLVVLEKVYNEQGLTTPYSQRTARHSRKQHQPTARPAAARRRLGLVGARPVKLVRDRLRGAGPGGCPRCRLRRSRRYAAARASRACNSSRAATPRQGIDETYHLNMRAYTLYVLAYATGATSDMTAEGQRPGGADRRASAPMRAPGWRWRLARLGMQQREQDGARQPGGRRAPEQHHRPLGRGHARLLEHGHRQPRHGPRHRRAGDPLAQRPADPQGGALADDRREGRALALHAGDEHQPDRAGPLHPPEQGA